MAEVIMSMNNPLKLINTTTTSNHVVSNYSS